MKYIWLGGVYPKDRIASIIKASHGKISNAANLHQWSMIDGIDRCNKNSLTILNAYFLSPFPKNNILFVKSYEWAHSENSNLDSNIGFLNIRGIKNIWIYHGYLKKIKKIVKKEQTVCFVYTERYAALKSVFNLKKRYKFHVCLIVPDVASILSQYTKKKSLYNKLSNYFNLNKINKYISCVDSFVFLSEQMNDLVNTSGKPFCVVDGVFSDKRIIMKKSREKKPVNKRVVYTGSLHFEYGIVDLINDFINIKDKEFELHIAGSGNAENLVAMAANEHSNIVFYGALSFEKTIELQESAEILVNPRPLDGVDAKYSFPSKTIEYLLAKKPVLMNLLPCMNIEYEKYIFTPKKCGCDTFADSIIYIHNLDPITKKSFVEKGFEFVKNNKKSDVQMKKVLDMISKTYE